MKALAIGFACILALAGCGAQVVGGWADSSGYAASERDKAQCEYAATKDTQGVNYSYGILVQEMERNSRRKELFSLCMKSKGYVWTIRRIQ